MAGIVAALEADDHVGAARQPVDDLALAFVAPLGADDGHIGHVFALVSCGKRRLLGRRCAAPSSTAVERRVFVRLAEQKSRC